MEIPSSEIFVRIWTGIKTHPKQVVSIATSLVLVGVSALVYSNYVVPEQETFVAQVEAASNVLSETRRMEKKGISYDEFKTLSDTYKESGQDLTYLFQYPEKVKEIIKKDPSYTGSYTAWIYSNLQKKDSLGLELENTTLAITDVLPLYLGNNEDTPIDFSGAFLGKRLTLPALNRYIENTLLRQFDIQSISPIGIGEVEFTTDKLGLSSIGTFGMNLDFQATKANVRRLIAFIQSSGQLSIQNGRIVPSAEVLSDRENPHNLLINIRSADFGETFFDPDENTPTGGKLALEFAVKGVNKQQVLLARRNLITLYDTLVKGVKEGGATCEKQAKYCDRGDFYDAVSSIRTLQEPLDALKERMSEIRKKQTVQDVGREMKELLEFYPKIRSIGRTYESAKAFIDNRIQTETNAAKAPKAAGAKATPVSRK